MDIFLRILVFVVTAAVLSLYLYDAGAHRVYDVILSGLVIVATSLLMGVLAAVGAIVKKRVFDREDGKLEFAFPDNALKKLPWFFLVFIGKAHIMPLTLRKSGADAPN